jgi:hydroxypyruvate reductase
LGWPRAGLGLGDLAALTDGLLRSGASIEEINCVRKHCEGVKGGQLARLAGAARVEVFVLSDVLGDRLDVISSGPMAADPTTFGDAVAVMERRGLAGGHRAVMELLARGVAGELEETPKPGDAVFDRVRHRVIANNGAAVGAAAESLGGAGRAVVEVRTLVEGEAADRGRELGRRVLGLWPGDAVVWGGETTVTVGDAGGRGGRNQELALAAALEIEGSGGAVMSLATDGVDGPTDAAGGIVDGASAGAMRAAGVDGAGALTGHDSWRALRACGGLIETGATGTNVNDVMVGVRWR